MIDLVAASMTTPVGLSAPATAAAIRGGITRVRESAVISKAFKPQVMSLVGEEYLPPLSAELEDLPLTSAHRRMLRLAAPALEELGAPRSAPLLLALPEPSSNHEDHVHPQFLEHLAAQSQTAFDGARSQLYRQGGAGGLYALKTAFDWIVAGKAESVIVGGVDTFLDLRRFAKLDAEGRVHGSPDGFVPGEGAVFLLLGRVGGAHAIARIAGVGLGTEPGHRYSTAPYRGDGMAGAFQELFARLDALPKVRCVYAGFNGENMGAKEWGVAYLRHSNRFAEELAVEHPADCTGDLGASLGPLMVALAGLGVRDGYREAPALVFCTSDTQARAAAMVVAAKGVQR